METTTNDSANEKLIQQEFQALLDDYMNSNHRKKIEIIERAFRFAHEAHKGILRRSGEPYILHPIAVARIVCRDIGMGSTSICASLLHDVVEDTDYTVEDIEKLFGSKIAQIVAGLTKISGGIFGEQASAQAENFRKLLLTMSEDIRVILIKIADRLHNMRTLGSMLPSKQYKIAGETQYLYAPLAHRLGLFEIKTELEELSFKYEHPETYQTIVRKIKESEADRNRIYEDFAAPVISQLQELGIQFEIKSRIKSAYSIWNKMQAKNIPFEEVYDLYAVRIVYFPQKEQEEKTLCWTIYSVITGIFKVHPERIRDWINRPKANGYQALHVTVMGPHGNWIEVQIRSQKMEDVAERGLAAHWKYKVGQIEEEESELDKWLKTIKEILENPEPNALDFLDTIKLNLFSSEIFVFTPSGMIKTLPVNATALDFAFTLHSDMGYHCIAAKVNHRLVPLNQPLQSGDQVEILTSKTQSPKPEWIDYVTTASARNKLINALRRDRRTVSQQGEQMWLDFLQEIGLEDNIKYLNQTLSYFKVIKKDDLLYRIGIGKIQLDDTLKKLLLPQNNQNGLMKIFRSFTSSNNKSEEIKKKESQDKTKIDKKETYILREENGQKNYILASCCNPIAGDSVLGYINDNDQVVIHKRSCPTATKLKSSYGDRIVSAQWDTNQEASYPVTIQINGIDGLGVLNKITHIISEDLSINIRRILIETEAGVFKGKLSLLVPERKVVEKLCQKLTSVPEVKSAMRINELSI